MRKGRPFYLNLLRIRLPVGGWVSILHRVSGAALSVAVPLLLYLWMLSLRSPEGFAQVTGLLTGGAGFLLLLALVWATLHHLFAGLRHLGFDIGWGEDRVTARRTAWVTLLLALMLTGLVAVGGGVA